ncbi:MAG: DUF3179 domain-containing protein [Geminicoccaceae bacterium]
MRVLLISSLAVAASVFAVEPAVQAQEATNASPTAEEPLTASAYADLAGRVIFASRAEAKSSLDQLEKRGDPDVAATLIMAMRFSNHLRQGELVTALETVTGAEPGPDWFDWMLWQQAQTDLEPHPGHLLVQRRLFAAIDPRFLDFLPPDVKHSIRTEEIVWGGVVVDGIPALTNPSLLRPEEATYLRPTDEVFGVEINGDARAYPLRILNWHEMFNDVIGGVPVSLAYCTLCGAGILFDTSVQGRDEPFVFGSSGFLYRSNKLMYDQETNSLWNQFTGKPVVGPLTDSGIELSILPVTITSWEAWLADHPDTTVIDVETGYRRDYGSGVAYREYFASPDLMFPAMLEDDALRVKDRIFGVRLPGGAKAWPLEAFADSAVINDTVGFNHLVLVGDASTSTVRAYERGQDQTFAQGDRPGVLTSEAGEEYRVTEGALVPTKGGEEIPRVPGHVAYWFAWAGYLGDATELYELP